MKQGLSILDALENLNTLVDADSLNEIEVTEDSHLIPHKAIEELDEVNRYWMKAGSDPQTLEAIRETFRSVHDYLSAFYKNRRGGDTKRLIEGINTIMVLVGEAAKNLERFGVIFKNRVSDIEEYKKLQHFYRDQIIKESFREFAQLSIPREKPVEEPLEIEDELQELLSEEEEVEEVAGVHILNDIDVIKRDHLYELFYLRNEAGHNFYTYELARKIKLACDFGEFSQEYFGDDPLLQIKNWEDRGIYLLADKILRKCKRSIDKFYKEAMKYKEMDLVLSVHKALMALMLAANPRNLIRQFSPKGCYLYFSDYLNFMRQALLNREYQKFLLYNPPAKSFFVNLMDLIYHLYHEFFISGPDRSEIRGALIQMTDRIEPKKAKKLSDRLLQMEHALTEVLQKHPNGPVFKAVDIIREQEERIFDPIQQGNLPEYEFRVNHTSLLRMPCPVVQELINKAVVNEEFKTFLHTFKKEEHLLYINFQDRTSWKEHARCIAVEELSRQAEYADNLTVVTLAVDTDFYNQTGIYSDVEQADEFIEQFAQHLSDEAAGYYFSPWLKKELFPKFIPSLLTAIYEKGFKEKKKLSFLEKLDFIQLAYVLIQIKIMELVDPSFMVLSSKDGLDISGVYLAALAGFINSGKALSEDQIQTLCTMVFGPTLLYRERAMHREKFDRLIALLKFIEEKKISLHQFKHLFKSVDFSILLG